MVTRALCLGALALVACSSDPASALVDAAPVDVTQTEDVGFVDASTSDATVDAHFDAPPTDLASTPEAAVDAPGDVTADRGPTALACRSDEVCTAPATCDRSGQLYVRGLCTRACTNPHATPEAQQTACGIAGSTCLAVGFFGGRCLPQCDPTTSTSCPRGQACSSLWFDPPGTSADEPACVRFCTDDADCAGDPGGTHCRRRLGICDRAADDPTLLPDGAPCNPLGVAQCRGFCLEAVDTVAMHGVCASMILRSVSEACPDEPARITARVSTLPDQIAMCVWRACARDCDCPTGLACIHEEDAMGRPTTGPRTCRYPTLMQPAGVPCT